MNLNFTTPKLRIITAIAFIAVAGIVLWRITGPAPTPSAPSPTPYLRSEADTYITLRDMPANFGLRTPSSPSIILTRIVSVGRKISPVADALRRALPFTSQYIKDPPVIEFETVETLDGPPQRGSIGIPSGLTWRLAPGPYCVGDYWIITVAAKSKMPYDLDTSCRLTGPNDPMLAAYRKRLGWNHIANLNELLQQTQPVIFDSKEPVLNRFAALSVLQERSKWISYTDKKHYPSVKAKIGRVTSRAVASPDWPSQIDTYLLLDL